MVSIVEILAYPPNRQNILIYVTALVCHLQLGGGSRYEVFLQTNNRWKLVMRVFSRVASGAAKMG